MFENSNRLKARPFPSLLLNKIRKRWVSSLLYVLSYAFDLMLWSANKPEARKISAGAIRRTIWQRNPVQFCVTNAGLADLGFFQVCPVQFGIAQIRAAQIRPEKIG